MSKSERPKRRSRKPKTQEVHPKRRSRKPEDQVGINGVTFLMLMKAIGKATENNKYFINQKFILIRNPNPIVDKATVESGLLREEVALIHGSGITFKDRGVASVFKKDRVLCELLKKLQEVDRLRGVGALKF